MEETANAVKVGAVVGDTTRNQLSLQTTLSDTLQPVLDEVGLPPTALSLSFKSVAIGTEGVPATLYVTGHSDDDSVARVRSTGEEASIEFKTKSVAADDPFHLGTKTNGTGTRFFLWQQGWGETLSISKKTVTVNGALAIKVIPDVPTQTTGMILKSVMVDTKTGTLYCR